MTIITIANLKTGKWDAFGRIIDISCIVRNELNNRGRRELVYSIPDKKPIQPRTFPLGIWEIGKPLPRTDPYLAPFFIPTNASQEMPIWATDAGGYTNVTKETTIDRGYGCHTSTSRTTQGCIKVSKLEDLLFLVDNINKALDSNNKVMLNVVR
jgi:hypothetical protein